MTSKVHRIQHVRQYCVHVLNREVFSQIWFSSRQERDIVYDSYVQNLDALIEYATGNGINVDQYIKEIKTILLKSKNVREYRR